MKILLIGCILFAGVACKGGEPETDVIKAPEAPKLDETTGSGIGTGVRKIGEIKKN